MSNGQAYSDVQRIDALARLAANDGNLARTAREMGIPRATLRDWRDIIMPHVTAPPTVTLAERTITPDDDELTLADRVGREIGYIGFGNLSDIVSWDCDGRLRFVPSDELTPAQAALISEVRVKRRYETGGKGEDAPVYEVEDISIKTRDKLSALRVLAEITGLKPTGALTVNVDARQQVANVFGEMSLDEKRAALAQLAEGGE